MLGEAGRHSPPSVPGWVVAYGRCTTVEVRMPESQTQDRFVCGATQVEELSEEVSTAGVHPVLWGSSGPLAAWAQIGSSQSCLSALGTPWPFLLVVAETTTKVTKSSAFPSSLQPHSITNRKESEGPLLPSPLPLLVWNHLLPGPEVSYIPPSGSCSFLFQKAGSPSALVLVTKM